MLNFLRKRVFNNYLKKGYSYFTITEYGEITTFVLWKEGESNKTINIY